MGKYYKIKENYLLRGWQKRPCMLVNNEVHRARSLPADEFHALEMCTGEIEAEGFFITDEERILFEKLKEKGIVDLYTEKQVKISDRQKYYKYDNAFIQSIQWSITGKCNYQCKHCYMDAPNALFSECTYEQACSIIEQMKECGVLKVSLTGGEALVHPRFWDIVDKINEAGIYIYQIYSNGLLINEKFVEELNKRNMHPAISFSYDGTGGWHAWLRGVPEADNHIEGAFRICRENGLDTNAELCIHRGNLDELENSIDLLASWGCTSVKVNILSPNGLGKGIIEYVPDDEEIMNAYLEFIKHYMQMDKKIGVILSPVAALSAQKIKLLPENERIECSIDIEKTFCCNKASKSLYIDSNGYCLPCIPYSLIDEIEKQFPNIYETSFKESIQVDSMLIDTCCLTKDRYYDKHPECKSCEYYAICTTGCRGKATQSTGDRLGKDSDACRFFKNGYYTKFKQFIEQI